ncbi:hypothetical protein RJD24_08485 [Bacillaceae bacterium IKA-2]|nr:hypothetical protein RJD24_08485 [Bacillaceae bacterium IKA-2]
MRTEISKVFKMIADTLAKLNDDEFEKLVKDEGKLVFSEKQLVDKAKVVENRPNQPVMTQLRAVDTREDATKLLSEKTILKKDLITIAASFKVHINKSDNKAKIIEKIVEATVGATLRSKAIRETPLKKLN